MDSSELGELGDYYQTYCNKDAIITSECWGIVEEKLKANPKKISVLRGLFEDNLPIINENLKV